MAKKDTQNTLANNTSITNPESINPVKDPKSVMLKIHLDLIDSNGSIAGVHQDILLPCLKEPAFVKGAYDQVEKTLEIVGVDFFKKLVRNYFMGCIENTFDYSKQNFISDNPSVMSDMGYMPLNQDQDHKVLIDNKELDEDGNIIKPVMSIEDQKSSLNMNALDNTSGVIDLDVETEN